MFDWLMNSFKTPEESRTIGSTSDDNKNGGYAGDAVFTDENGIVTGRSTGIGVANGEYESKHGPAEVHSGFNQSEGAWFDDEGDINRGKTAEGGLMSFAAPEAWGTSVEREDGSLYEMLGGYEFDLMHGGANAHVDEGDGAALGLGFNLGSIGLSGQTRGSEADVAARAAVSAGPSLEGRMHWGDEDGDGHREYGFGADVGFFSFDLQSEDPIRTALQTASMGLWDGGVEDPERSNMTQGVVDTHDSITDSLAGVEDTQGTRGAPKSFGEMGEAELTMHAMFNEGMNDKARKEVLDRRMDAVMTLFGGMF